MVSTLEEIHVNDENGKYPREDIPFTDNARAVLKKRYLRKGADGQPAETVHEMFWRVASTVAEAEALYEGDVEAQARTYYDIMTQLAFFPNSPTFTGAGTPLGQLAACFVLPIEDDMGRHPDGIFQTLRNAALIQQTGGGNGFSFSRLRPRGDLVRSSNGQATGPIGFLRVYDQAFDEIAQGGTRRGANMGVLRVDHPDIGAFITCKTDENAITNFNISVGITDTFMRAVEDDEAYDLVNPNGGEVWDTVRARDIFDQIVSQAYHNGEPGVLFLDAANRQNPVPHLYEIEASNPCVIGETWVVTSDGPAQVKDLVGRFPALLANGDFYRTNEDGFFATGTREVLEIRTRQGYRLTVTPDHPMRAVTRMTSSVVESDWQKAAQLKPGDKLVMGDNRNAAWEGRGTFDEGYLLGLLVGDGTITTGVQDRGKAVISVWGETPGPRAVRANIERITGRLPSRSDFGGFIQIVEREEYRMNLKAVYDIAREYGLSRRFKGISPQIERTSSAFHEGFLRGLFDADGSVMDTQAKGVSVRLNQSNLPLLEGVQRMLHRLGIASVIYRERHKARTKQMPDGKGDYAEYEIKPNHELVISRANLEQFAGRIGFEDVEKMNRLEDLIGSYKRALNRERFVVTIESIESRGKMPVYDAHVPGAHAFDANGFYVHNCGEQFLGPYENCCLGSINLSHHFKEEGAVDWEKLAQSVETATRFLDNVVDANGYVPSVPQLKQSAQRVRRIGLGIMGFADMLYALGIRYGSDAGQAFAGQVMEFVRFHVMRTSIDLARERGPFPAIKGSLYDPDDLKWEPPAPVTPYDPEMVAAWGRPEINWETIVAGIKAHGIRNGAQTTIAPTGTISTVTGVEGYGCEPVFALAYMRHVNDGEKQFTLQYTSPLFEKALIDAGLDEKEREAVIEKVNEKGNCQDIAEIPKSVRDVFVVSSDVSPTEHVRMQAAFQAFVDNAISKTINMPASATEKDVADAYKLAWKLGCKGLTVYVTGSREKVVLETAETAKNKDDSEDADKKQLTLFNEQKKPRPRRLYGYTYKVETPLGMMFVTVNENGHGEGQPFEVFLNASKAGSETAAVSEAIGRLLSYVLRLSSPVSPRARVKEIIRQLNGIGGGRELGFGAARVRSLADGVAQVLQQYLNETGDPEVENVIESAPLPLELGEGEKLPVGDICPECGEAALVNEEGCRKCYACGYSEC